MKHLSAYWVWLLFPLVISGQNTGLTVTSGGQAFVSEVRQLHLQKGEQILRIGDFPKALDIPSLLLKFADGSRVIEQDFSRVDHDIKKIIGQWLQKNITVITPRESTLHGKLLAFENGYLYLQSEAGRMHVLPFSHLMRFELNDFDLQKQFADSESVLQCRINGNTDGRTEAYIYYWTGGIEWRAEYTAEVNSEENTIRMAARVVLNNSSGKSFENVNLKLLAGDIRMISNRKSLGRAANTLGFMADLTEAAPSEFREQALSEFHLYTLQRTTDLSDSGTKSIAWINPADFKARKIYTYNYQKDAAKITVAFKLRNGKKSGAGKPLPAGVVRIYKSQDGQLEPIGMAAVGHVPVDGKFQLEYGKAFDLRAERKILNRSRSGKNSEQMSIEIKLMNFKNKDVEIIVNEPLIAYRNAVISNSNFDITEKDANHVEFTVPVKAGKTSTLRFDILYTW